jgi:hypothetical protein
VLLAAGLTGCAAHQAKVFDAELKPFVDKNLTAITKYIGYPDTMLDVLGKTVYTWGIDVKVCKLQITTDPGGGRKAPRIDLDEFSNGDAQVSAWRLELTRYRNGGHC